MLTFGGYASAHQWLPTYPEMRQSYIPEAYSTTMELFNSRNDVEYYEIKVYDENFNSVKFATPVRIVRVKYLEKKKVEVYIKKEDLNKAVYICTSSKHVAKESIATIVASRICSKIK